MAFHTDRVDDSRARIKAALDMAYGSYTEQEGKKGDQWRDQTIGQLGAHIRHEADEIMANIKRGEIGYLVHNAMDIIELGAIILAHTNLYLEQVSIDSLQETINKRDKLINVHHNKYCTCNEVW